jgi:hypothetical protein
LLLVRSLIVACVSFTLDIAAREPQSQRPLGRAEQASRYHGTRGASSDRSSVPSFKMQKARFRIPEKPWV